MVGQVLGEFDQHLVDELAGARFADGTNLRRSSTGLPRDAPRPGLASHAHEGEQEALRVVDDAGVDRRPACDGPPDVPGSETPD